MRVIPSRRFTSVAATIIVLSVAVLPTHHALADDLFGPYIGGVAGQSQVEANVPTVGGFKENHSAFKVVAGIRPESEPDAASRERLL
jgi:hypothetical protein